MASPASMGYRIGGPWGSVSPPVKKVEVDNGKDERCLVEVRISGGMNLK